MKRIIVATDFSPVATNAAEYAADMAMYHKAEIYLMHVYHFPTFFYEIPIPVFVDEKEVAVEEKLYELKGRLMKRTQNHINIEATVKVGNFFPELKSYCHTISPFCVVIGTKGVTTSNNIFLGSNAVAAMKYLDWPVMSISPDNKFCPFKNIAVACNLRSVKNIPIEAIKKLAEDFNATLYILDNGRKGVYYDEVVYESGVLEQQLSPLKPHFNFLESENTVDAILDYCEKNSIDLLVTMPLHHGFIDRLIHKSHTSQFISQSIIPVLALHKEISPQLKHN